MSLFFWIAVFLVSIFVLLKSSDYFTDAAEKVGIMFGFSPFIVGVLIVALGTSIPEFASALIVALRGGEVTAFVAENVVGSNIANMFLVVGIGAVMGGAIFVKRNLIKLDLPILVLATTLFMVLAMWDGDIVWYEALLLIASFAVYLWYVFTHPEETEGPKEKIKKGKRLDLKVWAVLLVSVVFIYFSAKYTVDSVLTIAELLGIASSVLVMIVVALGTSLPEVSVTISAVKKKDYEVALGNVFGSNIFNATIIIGVAGLISPLTISQATLHVGLPFLGIATILYLISAMDREIKNYEGAMFLLMYLAFVGTLISYSLG